MAISIFTRGKPRKKFRWTSNQSKSFHKVTYEGRRGYNSKRKRRSWRTHRSIPHTQVNTRYEVEIDGRRRIGSTEKKVQSTHRRTYPSQPPSPPPPTGGGAGGHRGGGGGGGDDEGPDDSDDGSDEDDEDESEETDSETSSTQEVPQEELPEELRGQRVFCRRINGRGHGYSQRSYRNPRWGGGGGNSPSPTQPPGQGPFGRQWLQCQPTWVYMIQGPTGPIGLHGQDGRDGRDGANAPPVTMTTTCTTCTNSTKFKCYSIRKLFW